LRQPSEKEEASLNDKIMELKSEGKSLREIGAALGVSHTKVARILKQNGTV
jgi:DNA-directed RNA polymerase specialized sigma subunit